MPDFNPFAPTVEVGGTGQASAGPVAGKIGGSIGLGTFSGPQDNHWAAVLLLGSLVLLWGLYKSKFRFSMTVG